MHIAVTRRTEIFKRIVERATTTTAYRQPGLIGGAPGATLFPRIQPHGAAVEIPEFALDFIHSVLQTSVVQEVLAEAGCAW
jgi:hypothetical protein